MHPGFFFAVATACLELKLVRNYTDREFSGLKARFIENDEWQGICAGDQSCCTPHRYCIRFESLQWTAEFFYISRPGWTGRFGFSRSLVGFVLGRTAETSFENLFCGF